MSSASTYCCLSIFSSVSRISIPWRCRGSASTWSSRSTASSLLLPSLPASACLLRRLQEGEEPWSHHLLVCRCRCRRLGNLRARPSPHRPNRSAHSVLGTVIVAALVMISGPLRPTPCWAGKPARGKASRSKRVRPNELPSRIWDDGRGWHLCRVCVAPTSEIPLLAAELGYLHEFVLVTLSLALSYLVVFASGFEPLPL